MLLWEVYQHSFDFLMISINLMIYCQLIFLKLWFQLITVHILSMNFNYVKLHCVCKSGNPSKCFQDWYALRLLGHQLIEICVFVCDTTFVMMGTPFRCLPLVSRLGANQHTDTDRNFFPGLQSFSLQQPVFGWMFVFLFMNWDGSRSLFIF